MSTSIVKQRKQGWAVVTGASAGLGAEFARQLAARGYDLVLVARRTDRLEALASELGNGGRTETMVLAADLSAEGAGARLVEALDERNVTPTLLVNNAGFGMHCRAVEAPVERSMEMVRLNVDTLTELSLRLGARMATRGSGAILNVASLVGFSPTPTYAVYAATKAFVVSFTAALAAELAPKGVKVLALCPGATQTEFFHVADGELPLGGGIMVMTAPKVVHKALRALDRGRYVVVPGWLNAVLAYLSRISPLRLVLAIAEMLSGPPKLKAG